MTLAADESTKGDIELKPEVAIMRSIILRIGGGGQPVGTIGGGGQTPPGIGGGGQTGIGGGGQPNHD